MKSNYNFFFDIDGTLITGGIVPTDAVIDALRYARSKGCRVFLNTGRTRVTLPPTLTALDCIDGFCCGCGTYIECNGKPILERYIEPSELAEAARAFDRHGMQSCLVFEGVDTVYYYGKTFHPFADIEFHEIHSPDEIITRFADTKINKLTLQTFTEKDEKFIAEMSEKYDCMKCPTYWEIIPKGFDKGKAIQLTEELLGLDHAMSVAVGDSENDVKMMQYAPLSVAMGNAKDEVKAICDIVTDSVKNDGVEKMIYELLK